MCSGHRCCIDSSVLTSHSCIFPRVLNGRMQVMEASMHKWEESQSRRIPRVTERKRRRERTKWKRRNHQKGRRAVPKLERERWGEVVGGGGVEGSISNFSAELTVDGFPIRLEENSKVWIAVYLCLSHCASLPVSLSFFPPSACLPLCSLMGRPHLHLSLRPLLMEACGRRGPTYTSY